jgi:Zn-dependent protease
MKNNQPIRPIIRPDIRVRSTSETKADQTIADDGGPRSVGSSEHATHPTTHSFFETDAAWTPDQARKSELIAAVRAIENKSTGGFTKFVVLLVSLAVFVAAGVAWWDPWVVSLLVAVLMFHEAGHYVAMRLFGYRNVKMFFIPFLGAAVSGRHFNIAPWKKALVYLAGPLPGIVVSVPIMAAGVAMDKDWMFELGGMGLLLNTLNLLPIMPLDGGWIMHLTVFSRSPILELVARMCGIGVMFAFAFFSGSLMILFIAIPLVLSLPATFRMASLIRRLRNRPLPQPERDEIPDAAIRLLDDEIQTTALATAPLPNKASMVVQMYESLIVRPPGIGSTLAIWTLYGGAFAFAIFGGMAVLVSRDHFFNRDFFDSEEQRVALDVGNVEFQLGKEPIDDSYLAVARFDSDAQRDAAMERLSANDLEKYSTAQFGNVLLASVPRKTVRLVNDNREDGTEEDLSVEDEFSDELDHRELMREAFEPVDPAETWLKDIAVWEPDGQPAGQPKRLHIVSGLHHSSVQIRCLAPDAEVATSVVQQHFQIPSIGDAMYVPTWSPLNPPTAEQVACRQVLKRLIDGITEESSPEQWAQKQRIVDEQLGLYDDGDFDPEASAKYAAQIRELQARYTDDVLQTLEGDQAEVARAYQRFQNANFAHQAKMELQAIETRKRIVSGDAIVDDSTDQQAAAEPYPVMQSYLRDDTNRLGFATADQRNYHFASHVSGSVATLAELEAEWNVSEAEDDDGDQAEQAQEADRSMRIAMSEKEGRVLTLDVHRATDHAATVAAVVAFLKEQGFRDFELRYVVSTGELE